MRKFGVVVAAGDPESLRLHLTSHLRFTEMVDISFVVVPRVDGKGAAAVNRVVREFRSWVPPGMSREVLCLPTPAKPTLGRCRHAGAMEAAAGLGCGVLVFASEATVVGPSWRGILVEGFEAARAITGDRIGLLGARSTGLDGPQSIFHPTVFDAGVSRKAWRQGFRNGSVEPDLMEEGGPDPGEAAPASVDFAWPRISTLFAAVPAASYIDAGGFDQDLPTDGGADDALSIRLLRKGYHNFVSRCFVPNLGEPLAAGLPYEVERDGGAAVEDVRRGMAWFQEHYPDRGEVVQRELQWSGILR